MPVIPGTNIPAPFAGVFCNVCHLHGWRKPTSCPRCRKNDQASWADAHNALERTTPPPPGAVNPYLR
jgi:hypothetical protein